MSLADQGVQPVILGTKAEQTECDFIAASVPQARNLCGQTDLFHILALAKSAQCAIGNDTGPMHLIAAQGCPSVVLFSDESAPNRCAPRGPTPQSVQIIQVGDLRDLEVERVVEAVGA